MKKVLVVPVLLVLCSSFAFSQFDTLYTFLVPNEIILGVTYDPATQYIIFSSGGQVSTTETDNIWLRYGLNGNLIDSFPQLSPTAGQGFGFRDLCADGSFIYASDNQNVRKIDKTNFTQVSTFTGPNSPNRGMAYDTTDGTFWSTQFTGGPIAHFSSSGTLLDSCSRATVAGNAPYGIAIDYWTTPGTKWIWMNTPSLSDSGLRLVRYNTTVCSIDSIVDMTPNTPGGGTGLTSGISGGLEVINNHPNYPGKVIAIMVAQRFPNSYVMFVDMESSPITSVKEVFSSEGYQIKVFPNPFNASATLVIASGAKQSPYVFTIYDLLGREMKFIETDRNKIEIERGNLPDGIYFYKVMSAGKILGNGKLIIQD